MGPLMDFVSEFFSFNSVQVFVDGSLRPVSFMKSANTSVNFVWSFMYCKDITTVLRSTFNCELQVRKLHFPELNENLLS